jgi:hypothetical protein
VSGRVKNRSQNNENRKRENGDEGPANNAYIKYNTPMSLALEDRNHLSNHILIPDVFIVRSLYLPSLSFSEIIMLLLEKVIGLMWVTLFYKNSVVVYFLKRRNIVKKSSFYYR